MARLSKCWRIICLIHKNIYMHRILNPRGARFSWLPSDSVSSQQMTSVAATLTRVCSVSQQPQLLAARTSTKKMAAYSHHHSHHSSPRQKKKIPNRVTDLFPSFCRARMMTPVSPTTRFSSIPGRFVTEDGDCRTDHIYYDDTSSVYLAILLVWTHRLHLRGVHFRKSDACDPAIRWLSGTLGGGGGMSWLVSCILSQTGYVVPSNGSRHYQQLSPRRQCWLDGWMTGWMDGHLVIHSSHILSEKSFYKFGLF